MIEGGKKRKKLKSLIRFHSANKICNYNRGWKKGWKKKEKVHKNLQNKSKPKNNKYFSWVTVVRVLSLSGSQSPPHLPRMQSNTVLISGPAVGAAHILIWSNSYVFLPPMSSAIRTSAFSFVGALMTFYLFHRHRVCLVDCVDLICSLYSWWEGFGSSSLAMLSLGFNCGFISTSACGYFHWDSFGICFWGCPGGFGFAPVRAKCGGGAAAWVALCLAPPVTQWSWWIGQLEI